MNNTEKFWDRIANNFDKRNNIFDDINIKTLENTKKYLKTNDVVMDFGCATGIVTFELADKVKKIHGIDISSKMINAAKRKAIERKIENVDFEQTTIFDERYKNKSFDVILAFNILLHTEDTRKSIKRINGLLKSGGLIISVTPCLGEKRRFSGFLLYSIIFLLSKIGILSKMKFFKIPELENSIINGGFQIIKTESFKYSPAIYFIAAKNL